MPNALVAEPKNITSSGDVAARGDSYKVFGIILTGGADVASASLKSGGTGGTVLIPPIKAGIAETVSVMFPVPIAFTDGVYGTITGTTPNLTVLLRKITT